ncbi:MAG: hypothetical protein PVG88_01615 [Methyloceanibacter sp.]|jgi:hypothetical protein
MIESKNRMPHIQSRMVAQQHMTESEATNGQLVAVHRIPPGAVLITGHVEVVEAYSAGTITMTFVDMDGNETALSGAVSAAAEGFTAYSAGVPLRAPQGGWVKADCAGADPASEVGDVMMVVEYIVDGRWTEVMPEAGVVPADVAT